MFLRTPGTRSCRFGAILKLDQIVSGGRPSFAINIVLVSLSMALSLHKSETAVNKRRSPGSEGTFQ
jgi:hypothetical protein